MIGVIGKMQLNVLLKFITCLKKNVKQEVIKVKNGLYLMKLDLPKTTRQTELLKVWMNCFQLGNPEKNLNLSMLQPIKNQF
jgi:hypothetical protein